MNQILARFTRQTWLSFPFGVQKMNFWRIKSPNYDSDYKDSYINGSLEHPYGLPGVECDVCGETWGGSRILPIECPEFYRKRKNITSAWPISRIEHESLQKELMDTLQIDSINEPFIGLRPGDEFQPCFLDVPSRPRADFLWASLGSLIVSERIKDIHVECCSSDITVCPVNIRKVGKRDAKLPPPMPFTGEPEDIINEVPITKNALEINSYFQILILKESGFPPGGTPRKTCSGCKRPDVDNSTRELRMTQEMWKGDKIFFLATTLHIVVTDEYKQLIERYRPTNIVFEKI